MRPCFTHSPPHSCPRPFSWTYINLRRWATQILAHMKIRHVYYYYKTNVFNILNTDIARRTWVIMSLFIFEFNFRTVPKVQWTYLFFYGELELGRTYLMDFGIPRYCSSFYLWLSWLFFINLSKILAPVYFLIRSHDMIKARGMSKN